MGIVKGKCVCYVDAYRNTRWPTIFAAVPKKGSGVKSLDEHHVLRVNDIIHGINCETGEIEITVELVPRPMAPRT